MSQPQEAADADVLFHLPIWRHVLFDISKTYAPRAPVMSRINSAGLPTFLARREVAIAENLFKFPLIETGSPASLYQNQPACRGNECRAC